MDESEFRYKDNRNHVIILRNNYEMFIRRALDPNYGTATDRTQAMCDANNAADQYFTLTGKKIEEHV